MKKLYLEILGILIFVVGGTVIAFLYLSGVSSFWGAQTFWSVVLMVGWVIVSGGYFHQGWLVYKDKSSAHVSIVLPATVFLVQCVLFVKGVYYADWSLIAGAVVVNTGVAFSLYQILSHR